MPKPKTKTTKKPATKPEPTPTFVRYVTLQEANLAWDAWMTDFEFDEMCGQGVRDCMGPN